MAKRKSQSPRRARLAVPRRAEKHIARLGLRSAVDYHAWCAARGFRSTLQKSWKELEAEWCAYGKDLARARRRLDVDRDPAKRLVEVCAGKASASDFSRPRWRALAERVEGARLDRPQRAALRELVEVVQRRGNLLLAEIVFGNTAFPLVDGIVGLAQCCDAWIRSPVTWRPSSHNARRQFASLTRYLLARFPVPAFMDAAWVRRDDGARRYRDWFIQMGAGQNIRESASPLQLTNRLIHHFMQAPENYAVEEALRLGQIRALGGDMRLVTAVLGTRLGENFENEDFWVSVLAFFVQHPMLDRAQVGPIVDYLQSQRFESDEVFVARGVCERRRAPQPNLSMKGRSPDALLRQVTAWHRDLAKTGHFREMQWDRSGIREFALETGVAGRNLRVWRIRELLSGNALQAEGRAMRHCVATYAGSCAAGRCSIWAMELHSFDGIQKRQTVEVNSQGVIVQCRGRFNASPSTQEREILGRWAAREGLQVSSFIR